MVDAVAEFCCGSLRGNAVPSVFVSIAASKPHGLAPLPGALSAAQRMRDWASAHEYITEHQLTASVIPGSSG